MMGQSKQNQDQKTEPQKVKSSIIIPSKGKVLVGIETVGSRV